MVNFLVIIARERGGGKRGLRKNAEFVYDARQSLLTTIARRSSRHPRRWPHLSQKF